jgi:hypothetical protein
LGRGRWPNWLLLVTRDRDRRKRGIVIAENGGT